MERAGLGEIGYLLTAGGIVAIHVGTVPAAEGHDERESLGKRRSHERARPVGVDGLDAIMRRGGDGAARADGRAPSCTSRA